jgi:hypothetical protein
MSGRRRLKQRRPKFVRLPLGYLSVNGSQNAVHKYPKSHFYVFI